MRRGSPNPGPISNKSRRPAPVPFFFFFNDTATTEIYPLSLHDALPIFRLLRQGKGKGRSVLAILKPGDLFGEVLRPEGSMMEDLAVSSGKCEVWSIEGRDFRALLEARPALAVDVIRALNERVRQLRQRVLGLTRKDVPARLAEMLIALAQAHGERIAPGNELCLHGITQQDLADLVGASRSFVSTLINKMKRDGLLANQGRLLVLRDEEGLNRVAAREK